ncbi:hypothetical protein Rvan_0235 [Rhodomicrobium vannielii ATCC 17100]|uniref:YcxB-like C-terminal domain-containing protein n=2 Tax=Rhodomicrobium vannielii TaxID=1069 RepID=E3I6G4_RHOVT|nr:hypothetical protein Rvan_0235 [Rhodomicrobium vannielii ATCC 17100]
MRKQKHRAEKCERFSDHAMQSACIAPVYGVRFSNDGTGETMKASYTYAVGDYLDIARTLRGRSFLTRFGLHCLAATVVSSLLIVTLPLTGVQNAPLWFAATLAVVLIAVEVVVRANIIEKAAFRKSGMARVAVSFDLGDDGIRWARSGASGLIGWEQVSNAAFLPEALVVVFGERQGIALPARGFATPAAFDEARAFIRSRLAERGVALNKEH